mmetsp:Transcript_41371/g.125220  ORF Transcript_41371/g.125220 Transcript_41371/m.125220 type:complete len:207 (+) Transcript_41371:602-1222(+)
MAAPSQQRAEGGNGSLGAPPRPTHWQGLRSQPRTTTPVRTIGFPPEMAKAARKGEKEATSLLQEGYSEAVLPRRSPSRSRGGCHSLFFLGLRWRSKKNRCFSTMMSDPKLPSQTGGRLQRQTRLDRQLHHLPYCLRLRPKSARTSWVLLFRLRLVKPANPPTQRCLRPPATSSPIPTPRMSSVCRSNWREPASPSTPSEIVTEPHG